MDNRRRLPYSSALLVVLLLCAGAGMNPQPAAALSLNPLDYYSYDYYLSLSHTEVEPGEAFSVTVGASVRCTRDLPFGIDEAVVRFEAVARHSTSGEEITLLENYELVVSDVPDWEGDEYSTTETVDLEFPLDTPPGTYEIAAHLEHLSLDSLNVTGMVPSSARTMTVGSVVCALPDEEPVPEPLPEPGVLVVSILGHDFRPLIDADGFLQDAVDAQLIEGLLSIGLEAGTRCIKPSGHALTYISASRDPSPEPYGDGAVLSAFLLRPDHASFYPSIRIGISYNVDELPSGCEEGELALGYYDSAAGEWEVLPSTVDTQKKVVFANALHFTSFGLLAPTETPGPSRFTVRSLKVTPAQVAPLGRVNVAITIANTGDTEGDYPLVVSIDGQPEHSESVVLGPRQSRTVQLTVSRSQPGVYKVRVGDLIESFAVVGSSGGVSASENPGGDTPPATPGADESPSGQGNAAGLHPVYFVLLALAGVAFLTLVVLVLTGVL